MTMLLSTLRTAAAVCLLTAAASPALAGDEVRLQGAGATFPNPLYQKWVSEYQKIHPQVKIDYQSIGSGGGIKAIIEKTVHFAGSDAPLNKQEIESMGSETAVVQVPSCAGAVVPAYKVPGLAGDLNLTGDILAQIFMGKISKWNDPKIAALNAGSTLPDLAITPAWRTDGSGTTFVFTNYLATQSEAFKTSIGTGKQVKWSVGQGGKGNEGVAAVVQQTDGAIGYIELNYALQNKIPFGAVKNQAGKFVKASTESVSAAGEAAAKSLSGTILAANIWNQPGEKAYPISAFTYLIVYSDLRNLKTRNEADALIGYITWALQDGQKFATTMDYAPLSKGVQDAALKAIRTVTFEGKPVMVGGR